MTETSQSPLQFPIIGYHGTTAESAAKILENGFRLSHNPYDWLGDGVYFFQDGFERAWEWAHENHTEDVAVIAAEIQLIDCLDMLDTRWTKVIAEAYNQFLKLYKQAGLDLPRQTPGAHRLDREVINYVVGVLFERGISIRCVRATFAEGNPVYPDSAFYDRGHVQIAVRDLEGCITRMWLVDDSEERRSR